MAKKRADKVVSIVTRVRPGQPRLVYRGMNTRLEVEPVKWHTVEVVNPRSMTVFDGGRLLYANYKPGDGVNPCVDGQPLLERQPDDSYDYTPTAVALLTPERKREYLRRQREKRAAPPIASTTHDIDRAIAECIADIDSADTPSAKRKAARVRLNELERARSAAKQTEVEAKSNG